MTTRLSRWTLVVLSVSLLFCVACTDSSTPIDTGVVTMHDQKPDERTCALVLSDELKRQAKEISVGLWDKDLGDQSIVSFVLPDRTGFDLKAVQIVIADVPGSERERNAFIYVEGTKQGGERLGISSTVGRFKYLGKNDYALSWTTSATVATVGRRNIQSVGKYDGSDFKTGTLHNRLILYCEVK